MKPAVISAIRSFNRFYTPVIGLVNHHILDSVYSLPEARIFYELHHRPGLTASDLIVLLDMDKGYLSRILRRFEEKKLVSRAVDPSDKRVVRLKLTAGGEKEFRALDRASDRQVEEAFDRLSERDCEALTERMADIRRILGEDREVRLEDITIRTQLKPGDLGFVVHRHGELYSREYHYGIAFEAYVGAGICEFFAQYDREKDGVWIAEHGGRIIGFLLLMHRENGAAQLRYFYLEPEYRGIGLGKRMMDLFMERLRERGYRSAYLWTVHELAAAASLYTRHGFRLTEEKESMAFGKPLREQRYDLVVRG